MLDWIIVRPANSPWRSSRPVNCSCTVIRSPSMIGWCQTQSLPAWKPCTPGSPPVRPEVQYTL